MPLLRVTDLALHFGPHVILDGANFQLYKGDRVCLVGRNGAGKSTLMKLIEGVMHADGGNIWRKPGLRISRLEQELPKANDETVLQVVASGIADIGRLLAEYDQLAASALDDKGLQQLEHLQHEIEARDGWNYQQKIDQVLSRLNLPAERIMSDLSGGWRRRVALAKALVSAPEVLLLDEPTNHLDIETIEWLEKQLLEFGGAVLFITHDRALTKRMATKIVELDRGQLTLFQCGYDSFLVEREHMLEVEQQQNALFDKKLAREEVWIRQGIKARRTRNEGRVRALEKLRMERSERRNVQGGVKIAIESGRSSGKLVAELSEVGFSFAEQTLFSGLNFNLMRGDKIGLLGPNGVGKTTLIKLLLGELQATRGSIKLGTKLDVAYYDQMRDQLDDEKTIIDTVGQGRESITINGNTRHVLSYLGDFLFSPERARTPLKSLSGGERNRVQLACLFSMPANILVLDEPTNDLDVETLELLESVLVDFDGTILLVSHDRQFMDNVVTGTLAFEGHEKVVEYVGGYSDWVRQGGSFNFEEIPPTTDTLSSKGVDVSESNDNSKELVGNSPVEPNPKIKLSYKQRLELEKLPKMIETLEREQEELQAETASADFYKQEREVTAERLEKLAAVTTQLESRYDRWLELSGD